MLFSNSLAASLLLPCLGQLASAQGPNTVAALYPSLRTAATNGTFFLIPINSSTAANLASPYPLVKAPGFAATEHPLIVYSTLESDIRQNIAGLPAYIDALVTSQVILPFVDRLRDGATPFQKGIAGFIGGVNGQDLMGVVPALVGSLTSFGGYPLAVATQEPNDAPYTVLPGGQFSVRTQEVLVPNPVSGPGISPEAVDMLFSNGQGRFAPKDIMSALNQPAIIPSGQCQRNALRFNETFAGVVPRHGSVTLYSPALPAALTGSLEGVLKAQGSGLSGTAEMIGFNNEDCATAAKEVIVV